MGFNSSGYNRIAMYGLFTYVYGILLGLMLFVVIRWMFSVYYTPGVTTLYNSPVTQQLFPNATKKLFPTWGYNKAGMYDGQAFKFGAGQFYPESGKGYKPTKYASGGASPEGGMRPTRPIPAESDIGYWGPVPQVEDTASFDIYAHDADIPAPTTISVGWWGY